MMERLTTDTSFCEFSLCDADPEVCGTCDNQKRWERLQAYEQTGLEPDEIKTVLMLNRSYQYTLDGMSIPEFLELVEAKKEDRLIMLPCKGGDTIYTTESRYYNGALHTGVQAGTVYGFQLASNIVMKKCEWVLWAHMEKDGAYNGNAYRLADIGRTVFLTREEAEDALEKGGD